VAREVRKHERARKDRGGEGGEVLPEFLYPN